jgi:hypothetical protein
MDLTRAQPSDPLAQEGTGLTRGVEMKMPVVLGQLLPSARIPKEPRLIQTTQKNARLISSIYAFGEEG